MENQEVIVVAVGKRKTLVWSLRYDPTQPIFLQVNKDVCQHRLDFDIMDIQQPDISTHQGNIISL